MIPVTHVMDGGQTYGCQGGHSCFHQSPVYLTVLVVKASLSRVEDPGFGSLPRGEGFSRSSYNSDVKIGTPVATLAQGVVGSGLGLVGPVSVYCDWVRYTFDLQVLSQCGST